MIQTEFPFTLPVGYQDEEGSLHRDGTMRLATAADEDTTPHVCWVQAVIPPDATPAQLAQARNALRAAARAAREAPGRAWAGPIEVEDDVEDHGQRLLSIFIFRADA